MNWQKLIIAATLIMGLVVVVDTFTEPTADPTGMAMCPDCKKLTPLETKDHSFFLIVVLLVVAIIGAHSLGHGFHTSKVRYVVGGIFVTCFVTLSGIFAMSFFMPQHPIAQFARTSASVFAALGVAVLFIIGAIEINGAHGKQTPIDSTVWKDLEEVEDEWERK